MGFWFGQLSEMACTDKANRGKGRFWQKDDEISFRHVVFEVPVGRPSYIQLDIWLWNSRENSELKIIR